MKKEYDFSKAKRGAVLAAAGKTRITAYLDDVIIERFKAMSEQTVRGIHPLQDEHVKPH